MHYVLVAMRVAVLSGFAVMCSLALADEQKATVRPEIGRPIQAALDGLKAKHAREAMARVAEAEAVGGKAPFEAYLVNRVKGQVAAAAGEAGLAAEALEAALASPASPQADRLPLLAAAAGQHYAAKAYGKAVDACNRYFSQGGKDPALRTLQIQSLYLGGDFGAASKEILADVQAAERAHEKPTEQSLQMLAEMATRQKDSNGFLAAMEKLVAHYPKHDYWASLVHAVATRGGVSQQLTLDIYRIKLATTTLRSSEEYVEAAQYAIQEGFPAEATKFLDAGYRAGKLGQGPDAGRHQRLRVLVSRKLAEDTKTLGQDDKLAESATDGGALFNTGLNYVFNGQADKGLSMMQRAVDKGGFKRPDDARLRLGMAQVLFGRKAQGIDTLRGIKGNDGSAALARLWLLVAAH